MENSVDGSISSSKRASNSWNNPRKRPRSYDPAAQLEMTLDEDMLRHFDMTHDSRTPKRMRGEEWPLKGSDNAAESDNPLRLSHRKTSSSRQNRNSVSSTRPSKFMEGSMNDKISQRPPSLYIREEEAMEQYASERMEDADTVYDAGIESNKPSGMFRFGKAIANAFSSTNVWQGLNGIWKEKEKENQTKSERDVLKAKAELKYSELKNSGYKGTQNAAARPQSQEVPAIKCEDNDDSRRSSFRDSGVDMDEHPSSSDRKNSDQFITSTESLMPPATLTAGRSASPFSNASSGRRISLRFHKPSLEGLKKVKSQIHLPSIKRPAEDAPSVPSIEMEDAAWEGLRRAASKKDIAKQYRLSKKVSDLENKLETARRELELSIQEAPPVPDLPTRVGRKRFVPGALSSLPSERLLTPQRLTNDGITKGTDGQAATAVDQYSAATSGDDKGDKIGEHDSRVQDENAEAAKQAVWNKRASEIAARNTAARLSKAPRADTEIDDDLESEAAKNSISKGKGQRPRNSQEIKVPGNHDSSGVHKPPPKVHAKTPHNSPMKTKMVVPPVPARGSMLDPTKVDHAKLMGMRAIPDTHVPFGKAWDDMKNLRKEYPDAIEAELVAYMNSQFAPKKVTDHTSVSHCDRPPSPFLGRPGSISSMKTRTRASKRGISPPPPSLSSAKRFRLDVDTEKSPTSVMQTSPKADEEPSPFAVKAPFEIHEKGPEAPQANFEWDDDVF